MRDPSVSEALVGPFQVLDKGLSPSYQRLGDLVHQLKEFGPGRYLVGNAVNEKFSIVLYEDGSWRVSTLQLDLFDPPPGASPRYVEYLATKSPHTLT